VEHAALQREALPEGGGSVHRNLSGIATATWIRADILAMSRPSTRSLAEFGFGGQLKDAGVTAIFNTEEPFEHPYCGEVLAGAFTYAPPAFEALGLCVHLCGWVDLGVPPLHVLRDAVHLCCQVLDRGERIAVHCHAGFGRTGVLIACVLVHREGLAADAAIALVRSRRPQCVQNVKQQRCVRAFAAALPGLMESAMKSKTADATAAADAADAAAAAAAGLAAAPLGLPERGLT
jgi:hypothetical protein